MYRTLLIPLDGSPEAEAPLPALAALTRTHSEGARVVLFRSVSTSESQHGELSGPAQVHALEEAESYLRSIAVRMTRSGVDVTATTSYGEAADLIESQAQSARVDIIAMATHGRWGLDRLVHGSLAEVVLARARQPLLVFGPEASSARNFRRMLIPLDGGPFSAEVLPEAARFARSFRIDHIDLIAVLPPQMIHLDDLEGATPVWALEKMGIVSIGNGSYALDGQQPIVRERLQELQRALEYWGDWLAESGADVETHVRYDIAADNTAASTLAWARELQSDFIVMRTHARRGLARTLTGSVADELVRRSPLPVLLYTTQALESLSGTPGAADVRIEIEA